MLQNQKWHSVKMTKRLEALVVERIVETLLEEYEPHHRRIGGQEGDTIAYRAACKWDDVWVETVSCPFAFRIGQELGGSDLFRQVVEAHIRTRFWNGWSFFSRIWMIAGLCDKGHLDNLKWYFLGNKSEVKRLPNGKYDIGFDRQPNWIEYWRTCAVRAKQYHVLEFLDLWDVPPVVHVENYWKYIGMGDYEGAAWYAQRYKISTQHMDARALISNCFVFGNVDGLRLLDTLEPDHPGLDYHYHMDDGWVHYQLCCPKDRLIIRERHRKCRAALRDIINRRYLRRRRGWIMEESLEDKNWRKPLYEFIEPLHRLALIQI